MKFNIQLVFILLLGAFISNAQVKQRHYYADKDLVPRERIVDFTHLKLQVAFEPTEGKVIGTVEHDFTMLRQAIDSIELDAISMNIKEVLLDGQPIDYKNTSKKLIINFKQKLAWDSQHKLSIAYEATPRRGLYFIGWNDTTGRARKQIWTQGQGINNRHWIPMYDEKNDKVISEMIISFEEEYEVLSNGKLLKEKKNKEGKKVWHYKISHPHAPYLIMIAIGNYGIEKRTSASGVPQKLYYYPEQKDQIEPTYRYSVALFDFFEKEIDVPYPWETYAQVPVQDFMYGAMENTTATIFGDFYLVNSREFLDRNYVRVNAHELAHQWFGDMVTARSSAHHWLQESFATHYDLMYQREAFGEEYYDWVRHNYNEQALNASKKDLKPIAHSGAGTVRHYPKGALVLKMLKDVVGREQFNAAIAYYLKKHAYGNVDSKDLLVAFHERLGYSLNWFWEQWVYKGGEPHYQLDFQETDEELIFNVKQIQEINNLNSIFKMPIEFEVYYKDGSKQSKTVMIESQQQKVSFAKKASKEVAYYLFDPNNNVLKEISFYKTTEVLIAQAKKAEHMLDRYKAVAELIKRSFEGKNELLLSIYDAEEFHAIKSVIVAYFIPQLTSQSIAFTKKALQDDDVEVRKAVLNSTFRIPNELKMDYQQMLSDSSYVNIEKALKLSCFYYPDDAERYLEITEEVKGNRSHNVRITWLQIAYEISQDQRVLDQLVDYTSNSFEFLTRINAANALKELNYLDIKALSNLFNAYFSFNNRLSGPAESTINHFFDQTTYKKLIINYVAQAEWSDYEFERVKKYLIY